MQGLAPVDIWAIAAIVTKASGYAAALLAIGGPFFSLAFRDMSGDVLRILRRVTLCAAMICLAVLALRFGIRAARISGMGMAGMTDAIMLSIVWDSPLGSVAHWRATGAMLVLAMLIKGRAACAIAALGAVVIAVSYTRIGHALEDPRWLLAALLTIHLVAVGFWVAAVVPLYRASFGVQGAVLLHRFGQVASVTVPVLIIVGLLFAWLMAGSVAELVGTAYGWTLLAKLLVVAVLLGLAALNKLRLVPAFAAGDSTAATHLRRSIRWETLAMGVILLVTATLTSVTTPPVNL